MADVILTTTLPPRVEEALAKEFDCATVRLRDIGQSEFLSLIGPARAIVVAPGDPIDAALINRLPDSIRLLASYSTGLDHVDLVAADTRGIVVTSTPDVLIDATAEVAMLLILMTVRGAWHAANLVASGRWRGWSPDQIFGRDVRGKSLGIVGGGRIGSATASRAAAFGMTLAYWGRKRSEGMEAMGATFFSSLEELLGHSDVVSLHVPSTAETRNLMDRRALDALRPGSCLVNTARGDLIDEEAVLEALADGRLGGLGMDVFRGEPELNPGFRDNANVFVLPHIGSATEETRAEMGRLVLESLRANLLG